MKDGRSLTGPGKSQALLQAAGLKVYFQTPAGLLKAVDGVDLEVRPGEALGLVGESGCGKSVMASALLRLVPVPPGRYAGGKIMFHGQDLLRLAERELRKIRGRGMSIVFQDPAVSLNPIMTIGSQIAEVARAHDGTSGARAKARAIEMLDRVGIASPRARYDCYPHQLSGGMAQRAMIAMALVCEPELLIADEPTTGLDVTIQAQIIDLLARLRSDSGMSLLMITHDLSVIGELCDRVAVMYAGRIVEQAPAADLLASPLHPYTQALFRSRPGIGNAPRGAHLPVIPGSVPTPIDLPEGCGFKPRCAVADAICETGPELTEIGPGRLAACHFAAPTDCVRALPPEPRPVEPGTRAAEHELN